MISIQSSKIGERSDGRWNGSRELIGVKQSVITTVTETRESSLKRPKWHSYSVMRLVSDPMVDGMVPES